MELQIYIVQFCIKFSIADLPLGHGEDLIYRDAHHKLFVISGIVFFYMNILLEYSIQFFFF